MTFRRRLTAKQREGLYDAEVIKARLAKRGDFPICRLCNCPIFAGQKWHDNHDHHLPHALGGDRDGISHERCNLDHARTRDIPLIAKVKRIRQKHIGAWRTSRPMVGSVASGIKLPFRGPPLDRRTGEAWRSR